MNNEQTHLISSTVELLEIRDKYFSMRDMLIDAELHSILLELDDVSEVSAKLKELTLLLEEVEQIVRKVSLVVLAALEAAEVLGISETVPFIRTLALDPFMSPELTSEDLLVSLGLWN